MDAFRLVPLHHLIAEREYLGFIRNIALVRGHPYGIAAQHRRLGQGVRENVAGRHIATRCRELNREFAPDTAAAAGDNRELPVEFLHV